MAEEQLKPCPFCGGHVQPLYFDPALGISGIFCQECKAVVKWHIEMGPNEKYGENAKKWAERWNRRETEEELKGFINGFSKEAIPVVRCKDCKHFHSGYTCDLLEKPFGTEQNWFCADGERMENDDQGADGREDHANKDGN